MNFYLLFVLVTFVSCDERRTIQRTGYGVNFDLVGNIIDAGSVAYYEHTWALGIPDLPTPRASSIDCVDFIPLWVGVCHEMRDLVNSINVANYETILRGRRIIQQALETIVPLRTVESEDLIEANDIPNKPGANIRSKRSLLGVDDIILDQNAVDELEDLKVRTEMTGWEKVSKCCLPYRTEGQVFSDLIGAPGADALDRLKSNIRGLAGAVLETAKETSRFEGELVSVLGAVDARGTAIEEEGSILSRKITETNANIRYHHDQVSSALGNITNQLTSVNEIVANISMHLFPEILALKNIALQTYKLNLFWADAVLSLATGYLPEALVTPGMLKEALTHVTEKVLKTSKYQHFNLIDPSPLYYYKIKNVAYARSESILYLILKIPLYNIGGEIPLYRVYTFPVPATAGLTVSSDHNLDDGYSIVLDLPDYLAVTGDTSFYMEMTSSQFFSCSQGVPGVKNCGVGIEALKSHVADVTTCAYNIFVDDHERINRFCEIGYTKSPPLGSARQLTSDNSFIVLGGQSNQSWIMTCKTSTTAPTTVIKPCSMCRLLIPCGCSLTAPNFFIPERLSGCNEIISGIPKLTIIHHRNTAIINNLLDVDDLEGVRSFDALVNELYPPIAVPKIIFTVPDNVGTFIEKSDEYGASLARAMALNTKNLSIFKHRVDEGLSRTEDFSDTILDRSADVAGAAKVLISGIFGGDVWVVVTFIFGPMGLTLLALIVNTSLFLPEMMTFLIDRKLERAQAKGILEDKIELLEANKENMSDGEDNYGFSRKPNRVYTWNGAYMSLMKNDGIDDNNE